MNKKSGEAKSESGKSVRPLEKSAQVPKFSETAIEPENRATEKTGAAKVTNAVLSTKTSGDATGSSEPATQSTPVRAVQPFAVKPEQAKDAGKAEKPAKSGLKPVAGSVVRKEAEGWSLR